MFNQITTETIENVYKDNFGMGDGDWGKMKFMNNPPENYLKDYIHLLTVHNLEQEKSNESFEDFNDYLQVILSTRGNYCPACLEDGKTILLEEDGKYFVCNGCGEGFCNDCDCDDLYDEDKDNKLTEELDYSI